MAGSVGPGPSGSGGPSNTEYGSEQLIQGGEVEINDTSPVSSTEAIGAEASIVVENDTQAAADLNKRS